MQVHCRLEVFQLLRKASCPRPTGDLVPTLFGIGGALHVSALSKRSGTNIIRSREKPPDGKMENVLTSQTELARRIPIYPRGRRSRTGVAPARGRSKAG